jgi:integrase
MPKKASLKVTKTDQGWKVERPRSLSLTGKRERFFFKTREKALEFSATLKEQVSTHGVNAQAIRPSLADEAVQAEEILKPYGIGLLEAARRIVAIEKRKAGSQEVGAALTAFLLAKDDKSDSQRRAYEQMQQAFLLGFEGRILSTITPAELVTHVENSTGTNSTFNSRASSIKTFWRWSSKLPRNWCDVKVIEVLDKRETRKSEIGVLTAEQCKQLLKTAEEHYPECVPAFAISLFTGMRNSELERLQPENITDDGITLPASSTKTNRRRHIEMPPVLAAWLKAYPVADTVLPANWFRREKAVRRQSGWNVWCDLFDPPKAPEGYPAWPDNALRHSHASVVIALGKPLESLSFEFGHSGGAAVLKSHYVGVMTKAEATKIWSLGPKGTVVPFAEEVESHFRKKAKSPAKKTARKRPKKETPESGQGNAA